MGLLYAGEKRSKKFEGKTKLLRVFAIGWKRILKNTEKFGWSFIDEEDIENIHYHPKTDKRCRFTVWLDFLRIDKITDACPELKKIELIYNIFFLLRRILRLLMPIMFIWSIVAGGGMPFLGFVAAFIGWIICIILENILANTADKTLNGKRSGRRSKEKARECEPEDDDDDIVTLIGANGQEIDFIEIAGIAHKGNYYAILQPVELVEGMENDEALVFKVNRDKDGEDKFEIELDDEIIDAVFAEYNKLLDEAQNS